MSKQINCIIIDDEPPALALLSTYVAEFPELLLLAQFNDAIEGQKFLSENKVDLLFVDINMPDLSGIDLVKDLVVPPMVIFTTAHKKFALEGFELNAVDYLLKPISPERFAKAVNKSIDYFEYKTRDSSSKPEAIYVYSEYRMIRINLADILYIESLEDYVKIVLSNDKPVLTLITLKKIIEKLPADQFRRIHRSYIISVAQVRTIHNRKVKLTNDVEIPVSDSYTEFISYWKQLHS